MQDSDRKSIFIGLLINETAAWITQPFVTGIFTMISWLVVLLLLPIWLVNKEVADSIGYKLKSPFVFWHNVINGWAPIFFLVGVLITGSIILWQFFFPIKTLLPATVVVCISAVTWRLLAWVLDRSLPKLED